MGKHTSAHDSSAEMIPVSVAVDDEHLDRFAEVVDSCVRAGMEVSRVLKALGIINGMIARSDLVSLRRVPGVSSVEREQRMGIAPPESDVQ